VLAVLSPLVFPLSFSVKLLGVGSAELTACPQFNCGNTTGCWTFYGGTSAAAAQTALVNAARAAQGKQPIRFLDPLMYSGVGAADYSDIVP
jgi:hypothetical protein